MKLQTIELNKVADEELEKSIDDQKSVNTCRVNKLLLYQFGNSAF